MTTVRCENIAGDKLKQLEIAFNSFSEAGRKIQEYYESLESRIEFLSEELEKKNKYLIQTLKDKDRTQSYLNNILDSLTVGVLVVDCKGQLRKINKQALHFLNQENINLNNIDKKLTLYNFETPQNHKKSILDDVNYRDKKLTEEFLNIDLNDFCKFLSASQVFRNALGSCFSSTFCGEINLKTDSEIERRLEVKIDPAKDEDGKILGGIITIRDVSELRRLEKQAELRSRLTGMGEVAINVAHEIRNPLGSMELFASILSRELKDSPQKQKYLENISMGIHSIENIVSNILLFTRAQKPVFKEIIIDEILSETLSFIEVLLNKKSIEVDLFIPEKEIRIECDPELLKQVLLNLFLNAIQAMDEGGVLGIEIKMKRGIVYFKITDTGKGIPAQYLEKVFDPFFTTRRKGTGLGLTIVHNIIQMHNGFIEIRSEVGKGTIVNFGLPTKRDEIEN